MSRSCKKSNFSSWVCFKSDKPFRQAYNRSRRRKDHQLLTECRNYYKDGVIFQPYENVGECYGDICYVDEWYWDDPEKWVVGEFAKEENEYPCNKNICIGCRWSENCWQGKGFIDMWELAPDEKFVDNRIDFSCNLNDKWSWPSDGGLYYRGGKEHIRQKMESEFLGVESWEKYQQNIKPGAWLSPYWMQDYFILKGILPKNFTEEELREWYLENEEYLVNVWWKKLLRK